MIRVALDAMGSDTAPQVEVAGAARAIQELPGDFVVQFVGRREVIEAELAKHPELPAGRWEIVEAADVIGMGEKPLAAVRKKPNSSIVVGLGLQKAGASDAFVSAGNTGAILAAGTVLLGLHDGVERATVAAAFPTAQHPALLLDAGANVECTARELVNFARLGTVYVRDIWGRAEPAVGLVNIGEEEEKGTAAVREAHALLKQTPGIRFVGNVEGRDIVAGHHTTGEFADVLVADGFTGNVLLKFYESIERLIVRLLKKESPELMAQAAMRRVFEFLDYTRYGGAPLLGVRGIVIICHGASPDNAIKHAIRIAVQSVESGLTQHLAAEFARREPAAQA